MYVCTCVRVYVYLQPRMCEHMGSRSTLRRIELEHGNEEVSERCRLIYVHPVLVYQNRGKICMVMHTHTHTHIYTHRITWRRCRS